ncbi:sodium:solute symporter family transporter [Flammeovirga aprica]|uniref:Sodium transporter n=1 Tax=Flammeovirga aprica JL-4 TaxID=694437 RepID=A0A7X9RUV0_9BACT|nr:sodium transporter [Flammeovirga aprica]NME69137.1 sodium transporter [Flammeovirga aprica JL-4]
MGAFDFLVIIIFSLIVLGVGITFSREKDLKGFFAGGGAVPWGMSGLSLFMGFFSAGTFVVWGAIAYEFGAVAIAIQWTMCIAGFLVGKFIVEKWHKTGAVTVAEYLRFRFDGDTQKVFTYLFLLMSFAYTGAFLYPVAKIISVSLDASIYTCILVLGVFMILYTTLGGLKAVMVTDVLQFVILLSAIIIVIPLALDYVGGVESFISSSPDEFFGLVNKQYSPLFLLAFGVYNSIFIGGNWAYVQRYTSVATPKAAKKVAYLFGSLYIFSPILWMLPPMIYKVVDPNLAGLEIEGAYLLMCQKVLPGGMLGLMVGGMLYATASSVNGSLNISAAVITNDIVLKLKPNLTDKQKIQVARMATIFCGVFAIGVALLVPSVGGIVNVVLSISAVTGTSLYAPPIWSLFSDRLGKSQIIKITIASLLINVLLKILPMIIDWEGLSRAVEMLIGVVIPFSLLAINEVIQKSKNSIVSHEVSVIAKRRDEEVETAGTNAFSLKVMSYSLFAVCVLFLGIAATGEDGWIWLVGIGVLIAVMAYILLNKSKAAVEEEKQKQLVI